MLGISAAAQFFSAPGQSYSVAAFKEPMRNGLGITETDLSLAYGVATVVSGLALPFFGWAIDRWGARRMVPIITIALGIGCGVMSCVTDLPSLYLGFSLVRALGQGALYLAGTWIVGEWFLSKRGFATSLSGLGSAASVMTFPLVNGWLIGEYGWQTAWMILGFVCVGFLALPAAIWLRDRPEDIGLQPDGLSIGGTREDANSLSGDSQVATGLGPTINPAIQTKDSWPVREVLCNFTFWRLVSVSVTAGMVGTGLVFHQVSLMASRGVSEKFALGLISLQAGLSTVAALGAGWLTDRVQSQWLLSISMVLLALSVGLLLFMPTPWLALVFALLMGLQSSILRSAGTVVWVNYYGRENQGAIRGLMMSAMILAAAIGPLPLALSLDRTGSYDSALVLFCVIPIISAVLVATASMPRRPLAT